MKIRFSKFGDSNGLLGKRVFLDNEGVMTKESVVAFSKGYFSTVTADWSDFGDIVNSLKPNETLGMGVCSKSRKDDTTQLLTQGKIVTTKAAPFLKGDGCARTLENFTYHESPCKYFNVLMIDIDEKLTTEDAALEKLFELFPMLGRLPSGCWLSASAGAYIKNEETSEFLTELSGLHIYFAVPNSIQISDVKTYLITQSWLSESGYFKANKHRFGYSLLERHFIDMSVFSPERLDFIGGSDCSAGLTQERPSPRFVAFESPLGPLDFSVSEDDLALAQSLREDARFEVEGGLPVVKLEKQDAKFSSSIAEGFLSSNFVLEFDDGKQAKVWEIIARPEMFDKKTLKDPLFPEKGRCKAKYYFNPDGDGRTRHVVNSFVKGGQAFFLELDSDGAVNMLGCLSESEIKERFSGDGFGWSDVLCLEDGVSAAPFFEELKKRGLGNKTELKARMGKVVAKTLVASNQNEMESLNNKFAYVDVGAKPRILEDIGHDILLRTRTDFLTAVENVLVSVWTSAGVTQKQAGELWLKWKDRRTYAGILFFPQVDAKVFERDGRSYYNLFRGFTSQPVADRKCGRKHCKGKGCFHWYFSDEGWDVCPSGGWTYWLQTIHDVITDKNKEHTRWVLDWLVDIIQNPAGGSARPGTSLVVRGGQGTGKGSIVWPIFKLLGQHAFQCDSMSDITTNFNVFMETTILLFADEAVWGGSKKESGKLKRLITEDTVTIEPKGLDKYAAINYLRLYVSSNSDWVVPAESDERRYTVFDVTRAHCQDQEWFAKMKAADLGELMDEIKNWEITSDIKHNLATEALANQTEMGWSIYEQFVADLLEEGQHWDSTGQGSAISHEEIGLLFESDYLRHRGAEGLTGKTFIRRLRKLFTEYGANITSKNRIHMNNKWVYGFNVPPKDVCESIIGIKKEK